MDQLINIIHISAEHLVVLVDLERWINPFVSSLKIFLRSMEFLFDSLSYGKKI